MAYAFFDTSALIKRYVNEPGRREVLQLLRKNHGVVSALLPVEVRSALRRRMAEGTLDAKQTSAILKRFTADRAFWTFIEVSREVIASAESRATAHPLRALDAIQVASGQIFASRLGRSNVVFVTADERQHSAAATIGLTTRMIGP